MKRFNNLEFEDNLRPDDRSGKGEGIRDEVFFNDRAMKCYFHGDFEAALRNYSRALEVDNTFFEGWAGQVRMLIELGEYPEAMVWADKAMELFPEHPELLACKSIACLRDARFEQARGYSDNSISKANIGPRVWLARAEVLLQARNRIAETCLSKAFAIAGDEIGLIRLEAGRLLKKYQHYSAAVEYLQEAVKLFPKSAMAWYELGYCQLRVGYSRACVSLEQCMLLHPHYKDVNELYEDAINSGFFRKLLARLRSR